MNNLNVLIKTEPNKDWQTFCTWYSLYKNEPNADIKILCVRNKETPFRLYQWTKKVNVPVIFQNKTEDEIFDKLYSIKLAKINENLLLLNPYVVVNEPLNKFEENEIFDKKIWYIKNPEINERLSNYALLDNQITETSTLCHEVKESEELHSLVSYEKGCGKWINTSKGCPFSNAARFASETMTINETRIIELWKKLCSLYSALS